MFLDAQERSTQSYTIKIENWDGNDRPFRAVVRTTNGVYVGTTGACKSEGRAQIAARKLIDDAFAAWCVA